MEKRTLYTKVWKELSSGKSMIFVAGPRQSGKTTLSRIIADTFANNLYFNWDIAGHREKILHDGTFFTGLKRKDASIPLIILDEIHKYKEWKNYLKGIYDEYCGEFKFLITGSGRLDLYQKGGDSLAGRYFLFHLFPFTVAELAGRNLTYSKFMKDPLIISMTENARVNELWQQLSVLSGFPEPYLSGRETVYRRWSNTYAGQLVREDIRDLTGIKTIQDMETLYHILPSRIGSPLSVSSIAGILKLSYNTVRSWLNVLERFYLVFSIPTWTGRISRAIQKETKYYLFDYARIKEPAARLENMVAVELWRAVTIWNDTGYGNFSLHFIKDKEKREVDFLIAADNEPFLLIEVKLSEEQTAKSLIAFQNALGIPAVQLVERADGYRIIKNGANKILIAPAGQWLSQLP